MSKDLSYASEIKQTKNRLVNTSLVVGAIAAFPLLSLSVIRAISYNSISVALINTLVYVSLLSVTLLRKKIRFSFRAYTIIILIFIVGIVDLLKIGFMSLGTTWFIVASVMTFLYFDIKRAIYAIVVSFILLTTIKAIEILGYEGLYFDLTAYNRTHMLFYIRAANFLLVSLFIILSMKQITKKLQWNIEILAQQRTNLINTARSLRKEIEQRKASEKLVIENEQKFKNIFETSADPMVVIKHNGIIIDYNTAFLNESENDESKIKDANILKIVPEGYESYLKKFQNNIEELPTRFDLNFFSRKTGSYRYLDVTTSIITYEGKKAVLAIFRDNTEKINHERNIYSAALQAEEKERLRMSKELHDGLGPLLSTLKIYFEVLAKQTHNQEIQKRIAHTIEESIKGVREISNNLSPYLLQNLGLIKALNSFIDKINFTDKINIHFNSNFDRRFNEKIEITIYRLITELINNTLKHAKAKNIIILLAYTSTRLCIEYSDDGIGFETNDLQPSGGIGLFNMKSRVEKMGGSIQIESEKGKGFKMKACIDINQIY